MSEKPKKDLWCPTCKEYPDEVIELCEGYIARKWNGEVYEGYDEDLEANEKYLCRECDTPLEEKEQDAQVKV